MFIKRILSNLQNSILSGIYKIKPKFFFHSFFRHFENYPANPNIVGLKFSKNTKIANKGEILFLPNDVQITWQLMRYGELNYPISKIIQTKLNKKSKFIFIDIGANVGLVSRQVNHENKNVDKFICVEPVKNTYDCLTMNTSVLKNLKLFNFGLGIKNEKKNIFIDKSNHGNASLEKTMMKLSKYKKYYSEKIVIKSVKTFFNLIKNDIKNHKLIIKIDTQSFDELILSQIPMDVIKKTVLLNYELTSIDGVKKQKICINEFKKRILNFNKIWSEEIKNIDADWLVDELNNNLSQSNIETDIYLMK
tara:strand:- start:63 stop:980 length:918 start_codon:yes stop_codon:yes gene_type:complete